MENKYNFNTLTLEQMVEYIEKNAPKDKAWFKEVSHIDKETRTGTKKVYSHLKAKREFCKKYMPEIIPVAKPPTPKASDLMKDW